MRRREAYDERRASRAVAATTAGRAARPGVLWGLVFGATIASSASTYLSAFPTAASRTRLALSMRGNAGFAALFGPIRGIDTVAGYTAYKTLMFSVILAAVWGLLVATRLLRGEEDAGRWELFLSGQTTRGRAALQAAIGLGAGIVAVRRHLDRSRRRDVHGDRHARRPAGRDPARRQPGRGGHPRGVVPGQDGRRLRLRAGLAQVGEPTWLDRGAAPPDRVEAVRLRADRRPGGGAGGRGGPHGEAAGSGGQRVREPGHAEAEDVPAGRRGRADRKSTRLNSSHVKISY